QGTSGQVMTIPPTRRTRKRAKVKVVMMIIDPTQYPGSLANFTPQFGQRSCRSKKLVKMSRSPPRGQRRRRPRLVSVVLGEAGSRIAPAYECRCQLLR